MSDTNDVRLVGYCASAGKLRKTKSGQDMLSFVVYTRSRIGNKYQSQPHRCIAFGRKALALSKEVQKGKHIYIFGMNHTNRVGEGKEARYYTSVLVERFHFTPVQGMMALKDTIKDILEEENITSCDELDMFTAGEGGGEKNR